MGWVTPKPKEKKTRKKVARTNKKKKLTTKIK
jgi:hypothetical protein